MLQCIVSERSVQMHQVRHDSADVMEIPFFQIDAFTGTPFRGNPAAVCLLDAWLDDAVLQAIAAENNLPETAFAVPCAEGHELRCFTPTTEVDLCGHATLAAAHALFETRQSDAGSIRFFTRQAGPLLVSRDGDTKWMDFPARPPLSCSTPAGLEEALGSPVLGTFQSRDLLVELSSASAVRALEPSLEALAKIDAFAICVTAPGTANGPDFVSRFFAPRQGIPEDPVTGSAHCTLAPFWAERTGKREFTAAQLSPRRGTVQCRLADDRVKLGGEAVTVIRGTFTVPHPDT